MIERVCISGYRCFELLEFEPNPGMNLLVGANESGKSTVLEAVALALTGKVNGRWAAEELNPFWFHAPSVRSYFVSSEPVAPPEILIELYFGLGDDGLGELRGVHNVRREDCPGVSLRVAPAPEFTDELAEYMGQDPPPVLPVEYYEVDWRDFSDRRLVRRPKELSASIIDSRTIRSTSGVDYHTREMLSQNLDAKERADVAVAHRSSRQRLTDETLKAVNERLAAENAHLHHHPVGLQMDQSARSSWEAGVVPQVENIPFAMAGQGQQAAIKVSLAMSRKADARFVLVEEPENHMSHTSLRRLLSRMRSLSGDHQQLFISTHSSFVLNRLGIDALLLLGQGNPVKLDGLEPSTVAYFQKLSGYDTLRLVLAEKLALVEGPSDAIILERAFLDLTGSTPDDLGVDIVSMGGLTHARALELCSALGRQAVALQDNDGKDVGEARERVVDHLEAGQRDLLISHPAAGPTLEPQLVDANGEELLGRLLPVSRSGSLEEWMENNKTESALRLLKADVDGGLRYPSYIVEAIELLS